MKGDLKEIVEYAQSVGFSDDELRDVVYNRHLQTLRKAMLFDKGQTVVEKKTRKVPKMQRAANGQFVSERGQVDRLIKRAQSAKGANKREAQADAVAAMLLGASKMADQNLAPTYGNVDAFNLKSIETGGVINESVMQKIFDISSMPPSFH